jgi:sulfur-carrier protein adenylyltransferase/sulfurtransferase
MIREIEVAELKEWNDSGKDFQLIDVREPYEFEIANLNGELIPMGEIAGNTDKISKNKDVVVYCRSGKRSADVIHFLQVMHGFSNLFNLRGGILAWSDEIDPSVPKY